MKLSYSDWRRFDDKLDTILANQATILSNQAIIINRGAAMDAQLQQVIDDLDTIKQEAGTYIAGRDAIDAQKDATIKDLTDQLAAKVAQGAVDAATIADFKAGVATALAKADEDKALLAPPTGVPVSPAASYSSAQALTDAVTAYQAAGGKDGFTLDGNAVGSAGTSGTVNAYFTHSADSHVDQTGPTD